MSRDYSEVETAFVETLVADDHLLCNATVQTPNRNLVLSVFLVVTLVAWVHGSLPLLLVPWTWILNPLTLPYSLLTICFEWVTFLTWVSSPFPQHSLLPVPLPPIL